MPEGLKVLSRRKQDVVVLEAGGYINNEGGEKIAAACNGCIAEGLHHFVLNLKKSDLVNSVGISYLIEVIEQLVELEGQMAFCCVEPAVARTFRIMGLLNEAGLYDTEEEALQAFGDSK